MADDKTKGKLGFSTDATKFEQELENLLSLAQAQKKDWDLLKDKYLEEVNAANIFLAKKAGIVQSPIIQYRAQLTTNALICQLAGTLCDMEGRLIKIENYLKSHK
jgi:hypothetical protein